MTGEIATKAGPILRLYDAQPEVIEQIGAGVFLVTELPDGAGEFGVFLSLQNMRDLLSSLAGAILPAAERADELGLDDQDGPVDPTASAP